MEKINIISNYKELSEIGCSFFQKQGKTYITSTELRWLTVKKNNTSDDFFCDEQKRANDYIDECSNRSHAKLNMKVLLYKDPTKLNQNNHIVRLINAGAVVRFKKMDNTVKICLSGNELFISYANYMKNVVNKGVYYIGDLKDDDPMIEYYKNIFDKDFETAREVIVHKDNLSYTDKWYRQLKKNIKESQKEIILMLIGALLGGLLSFIISWILLST